ncbi:hypothetical protein ACFCXS_10255 [Streptomyces sp. NPDC056373]|uniref:hypothetical protein n=1 Tax=Streptomyces sp. NPDC056373 TaxID=3345798 RepID=UPI0035DDEE5D
MSDLKREATALLHRAASGSTSTPLPLTPSGDHEARIWVDTWGESFFACDELRWLAYVSGAAEVNGPVTARPSDWVAALTP